MPRPSASTIQPRLLYSSTPRLVRDYIRLYQELHSSSVFSEPLAKRLQFFAEELLPLGEKGAL